MVKNPPANAGDVRDAGLIPDWGTKWAPQVVLVVKNWPANAGDIRDMGSIPGLGRFPGGGDGNPL